MLRSTVLLFVASLAVLAGCESSVELDFPTTGLLGLTIRDGANTSYCDIDASSSGVTSVATWIETNRDGWDSSIVTYAPSVQLNGDGFSVNFVSDLAVINYNKEQLTHLVSNDVYAGLVCP